MHSICNKNYHNRASALVAPSPNQSLMIIFTYEFGAKSCNSTPLSARWSALLPSFRLVAPASSELPPRNTSSPSCSPSSTGSSAMSSLNSVFWTSIGLLGWYRWAVCSKVLSFVSGTKKYVNATNANSKTLNMMKVYLPVTDCNEKNNHTTCDGWMK